MLYIVYIHITSIDANRRLPLRTEKNWYLVCKTQSVTSIDKDSGIENSCTESLHALIMH